MLGTVDSAWPVSRFRITAAVLLYVTPVSPRPATIVMERIQKGLGILISRISEKNYDETFANYRLWFEITQTYSQEYPDQIFDSLFDNRGTQGIEEDLNKLNHSTAHLIVRFAGDAESDNTLGPYAIGLQNRLCTKILQEFFESNMGFVQDRELHGHTFQAQFIADANFIGHWANLGYIEESAIRNHILQSLISHPGKQYYHQADALFLLFKLAGATFEKYVDPSVIDRCFERLKGRYSGEAAASQVIQVHVVSCHGWLQLA